MPSGYNAGLWGLALSVTGHAFTASGLCLQKIVHRKIAVDPSQVLRELQACMQPFTLSECRALHTSMRSTPPE